MALVFLAAGCVRYSPAPISVAGNLQSRATRTLDQAAVDRMVHQIAPRAEPSGSNLDRLSLFAAILILDPRVEAARAAIETAKAQARASRKGPGAVLNLTSEYANDPATRSPWLLGGTIDIPIDAGGRRIARLTTANIAVSVARYSFAETLWAERMAVRRALTDRMIALRQGELARAISALRERQLAVMERKLHAGAAARPDIVPVRLAQTSAARIASDADARRAQADQAIAALLGLSETGLSAFEFHWAEFDTPADNPLATLAAGAREQAITARSDILKALAAYDQAEADLRGEVARQYPAIIVSPGYTWERGLVKLPLSVGLALPPLDLNRNAIAAAMAKRDQAGKQIEAQISQAAAAFDAAAAERRQSFAILTRIRSSDLPAARRLAAQADAELGQGSIDRAEWVVAQIAVLQYRQAELDALARVQAADAALEDAMQRPLEGPEQMIENVLSGMAP